MNVLVMGGGDSPERAVSERSAAAVMEALKALGHTAVYFDPQGKTDEAIMAEAKQHDVVFPIMHGAGGEDGTIQRVLERAGVPYLGADATASELCFDKARLKKLLAEHGVLTPAGEVVNAESFWHSKLVRRPFVLKPVDGGSSLDTMIVRELPFDEGKAEQLLGKYPKMLLEELIEGVEITIPVLGDEALPVIEIVPPEGREFDYEFKYNGETAEICPARTETVSAELQTEARRLAERVHKLARVRHLSRTDMILTSKGELYVLEINTMPGLTRQSLFPKGSAAIGMSWEQLVARFLELAT